MTSSTSSSLRLAAFAYPAPQPWSSCKCKPSPFKVGRFDPTVVVCEVVLVWVALYLCLLSGRHPPDALLTSTRPEGSVVLGQGSGSHFPVSPRRWLRAISMQLIKTDPANGLARKEIAPAFSACVRTLSSGKAVMKMNGAL